MVHEQHVNKLKVVVFFFNKTTEPNSYVQKTHPSKIKEK